MNKDKLKAGLKNHCESMIRCEDDCPYKIHDPMLDPRIDPDYNKHVLEKVKHCRDELIADCYDYIEQLEKRIEETKPKWITKDKPPKSDVSVDVWLVINNYEEHNLVVLGCYWNGKYRNIRGHDISGWVTHWMEYKTPEPPKGIENNETN